MASLPPSPFSFADKPSAETLVVVPCSQAPVPAASGPFDSGARPSPPDEAVASLWQTSGAAAEYDSLIDCIGEIFAGARKMFDPDPAAYTREDELLYDVLRAMDDPYAADLIEIPAGMWLEFDPPPLFIQQQMRA